MKRKIIGFHQDEQQDWIAELDCFHGQHVRHRPPFFNRPWVASEAGRAGMLGVELDCILCDRLQWPPGLVAYRRSSEFTGQTIPKTMLEGCTLETGTWAKIHVVKGSLLFVVHQTEPESFELNAGAQGTIAPGMRYRLEVRGEAAFYVEFFSRSY